MTALHSKNLSYNIQVVHPAKLKKVLPPPHLVPVMKYDGTVISDSKDILQFLDTHHATPPFYPSITPGHAAAVHWDSVEQLETFAHDVLSMLYNYFGVVPVDSQRGISRPIVRAILPAPLRVVPLLPTLGGLAAKHAILSRITPILGAETVSSPEKATARLVEALKMVEQSFSGDEQQFLFDTQDPTAADFGVFAALKRLLHPLPDVFGGIDAGLSNALELAGGCQKTKAFFDRMDTAYYVGKVDWKKATL